MVKNISFDYGDGLMVMDLKQETYLVAKTEKSHLLSQ